MKKWKAPATVLLSLYVPPGRPIADVLNNLRQELSISQNIKLKRTRDAVEAAISAAIDRLTQLPKVPDNGIVLFSGKNFDTEEFKCILFSPPEKVSIYFYRTDKEFHTEFLEDMIEENDVYGLLIIERDEATIGMLRGSRLEVLDELQGYIPGKHHKGGQSQRREARIIEELVHEFHKEVGDRANSYFLPYLESKKLKGILVGGPGFAKQDFVEGDYLDYRLKKLVMEPLLDVSYQGDNGLREMVTRAGDALKGQKLVEVQKALEEIKYHLAKADDLVVYGRKEIETAMDAGALEYLVVYEDDNTASLIQRAENSKVNLYVIGDEVPEAEWIRKTFAGAVGKLRYKL
ncbi:peptide chain release factor 1 [Sulfodiicoccus acidiphilus]|uniref:Peptide chain release factor subunit 1 n=1 Tax=Sulfodiicoccus acidiphilus TaxID=1670455 RepID=A0A348B3E3_9CREN|nr:peptide chain release factor 1 [Sulfodiicoccus acidiphilus]GGT95450.1 peptide chain release factor 1 [Sulfodiicoccus acidiphilus]